LAGWRAEREEIETRAKRTGIVLSEAEKEWLKELHTEQIEAYLDSGHGKCWLKYPEVGGMVADALTHFDGERYVLHAWIVMSNHVHAVVTSTDGYALESVLHSWKSFTAHEVQSVAQASRLQLPKSRPFWQRESYDRLIRNDAEFVRRCDYTIQNPVTAGLCEKPEDWPLSSASAKPQSEHKM
jgi:REP element-mobilizing transposase RayT